MNSENTIDELVAYVQGAIDYMRDMETAEYDHDKLKSALWAIRRLSEVSASLAEKAEAFCKE